MVAGVDCETVAAGVTTDVEILKLGLMRQLLLLNTALEPTAPAAGV